MPIDSQVEVKQVRLVKGTGAQIEAASQAGEILETDLVVQTDAPELVPETRTINNKPLSSNISLDASDVGALPDSTTIGNATLTIQKNGTTIDTFTANATSNKTINVTVPTKTSDITNDSGFINNTNDCVHLSGVETMTSAKKIFANDEVMAGNQAAILATISNSNSGNNTWIGRYICGAKNLTFLMGTYNSMAGLGAHSWSNAQTGAGAAWADFYLNPDGAKTVYIGGYSWAKDKGWFKVQNSGSNTGGKTQVNIGSISSANWKDVAYKGENISDFNNNAGYTTNIGTVTSVNNTSPDNNGNVSLSIPTVNDATLTIQKNGTGVATFTANASSNVTANITVPTDTSDLTNGAGFITGITSTDVTNALGYTPYNSSNPNGYTSNVGTVTSVNNVSPVSGNVTLSIPVVDQSYDGTSSNAQSGIAVKSAIDSAISSVYKPAGSVAFASLPTLGSSIEGYVYNITDAFTTTSDFVEGAGKSYPAGTNIVCIDVSGTYKWDVLSGIVDLSGYVPTSRTINNKALTSNISLSASDVGALPDNTVIPTVNNATLTIQKNGTSVKTFTANASTDVTCNITVPTDTSDLTNGAGFITSSALSGYIPYSGATGAVDLNEKDLKNVDNLAVGTSTIDNNEKLLVNGDAKIITGTNGVFIATDNSQTRRGMYNVPMALEIQFNSTDQAYSYPLGFHDMNSNGMGGQFLFTSFSENIGAATAGDVMVENDKGGLIFNTGSAKSGSKMRFTVGTWTSTPQITVTANSVGIKNLNPNSSYALDVTGTINASTDIKINGSSVALASSVPTATSDLINDSGFVSVSYDGTNEMLVLE